jgi:hypothetical protein
MADLAVTRRAINRRSALKQVGLRRGTTGDDAGRRAAQEQMHFLMTHVTLDGMLSHVLSRAGGADRPYPQLHVPCSGQQRPRRTLLVAADVSEWDPSDPTFTRP